MGAGAGDLEGFIVWCKRKEDTRIHTWQWGALVGFLHSLARGVRKVLWKRLQLSSAVEEEQDLGSLIPLCR